MPALDASRCLGAHDKGVTLPSGCGELPPWLPSGVEAHGIAGDVAVDRTLFDVPLYSTPLAGDGLVPVASAHGYPTSGPGDHPGGVVSTGVVACRVAYSAVFEDVRARSGLTAALALDQVVEPTDELLLGAARVAPCSNAGLPGEDKAVRRSGTRSAGRWTTCAVRWA